MSRKILDDYLAIDSLIGIVVDYIGCEFCLDANCKNILECDKCEKKYCEKEQLYKCRINEYNLCDKCLIDEEIFFSDDSEKECNFYIVKCDKCGSFGLDGEYGLINDCCESCFIFD